MPFRKRLLIVMLAVMVIAQLVTAGAILSTINRDVMAKGDHDLEVGLRVLRQVLDERGRQLLGTVEILADDFGFKSAVATQDTNTLVSVLANHGDRAGADMVLLTDPEGRLMASSHHETDSQLPFPDLWQQAQQLGGRVDVVLQDGRPYQFVLLPVKAPHLLGWVGMGFLLDTALVDEISNLTQLSTTFLANAGGTTDASYVASSRGELEPASLAPLLGELHKDHSRQVGGYTVDKAYRTRALALSGGAEGCVYAIVQIPHEVLLAAYRKLQWQLLTIFAVTLALTAIVAALSARSMSRPLGTLADAARRIGHGQRLRRIEVPARGEVGLLAETLLTMQEDIDRREATLLHQSRHDQLTGLPNRTMAQTEIAEAIAAGHPFTLLRLAVDDFRRIIDTFGYEMGDRVLIALAKRLTDLPHPAGRAYRLGSNEFLLRLDAPTCEPDWFTEQQQQLIQPIDLHGSPMRPSLSFGEVSYPEHGDSTLLLLRRADIALDLALDDHRPHQRYLEGQDERHLRRLTLVRDLQEAAGRRQLTMAYQPKLRADSGEIAQFEALMRWQHPSLGFVPPDEFIALAERSGNIRPLSRWMIDTVCRQLADWQRQGHRLCAAVNLSAEDVIDESLPDYLLQTLATHGLSSDRLGLEVTESAIMKDPALATRLLEELRRAGMSVAVDDFGTGHSSLAQLRRLPAQELKIDKSFILRLGEHDDDEMIVRSTIELGHNLGLEVVAEGVETPRGQALLQALGCDYLQGYLISRPLPADQVLPWVVDYRSRLEVTLT